MIKSWLTAIGRRRQAFPPVQPERPFYAIGDIHGRFDLLQNLLGRLDQGPEVVCLGDYIDRGEYSAEVLRFLHGEAGIRCLKGNHEAMLLDFLETPRRAGPLWLSNGGLQTLASFGVGGVSVAASDAVLLRARDDLQAAMGEALIAWLDGLPLWYRNGNVFAVHAGADPAQPVPLQPEETLLWGHPDFGRAARGDGAWIVHGHRIVDAPRLLPGQISTDTGAFATGRLTAARIEPGSVQFTST